jgi:hypothetical protein
MSALVLIALVGAWTFLAVWLTQKVVRLLPSRRWRGPVTGVLIAIALALPVTDELVGGYQFRSLCERYASSIQIDRATAMGRTVYFVAQPPVDVSGTWIRVVMRPIRFVDARTGEAVVSYNELGAVGGWLSRTLPLWQGQAPLTFTGTCFPANRPGSVETFSPYGMTYVEPPFEQKGSSK